MTSSVRPSAVSGDINSAVAELIEDLASRLQAGEALDAGAIIAAHPEHAEPLRRLLPAIAVLADLGRSASAGGTAPPQAGTDAGPASGVLGDFRILREVGRGGMGVVYEAEQISLGRRVALKVLPFAATMDPRQLQRFKNEAQAAAGLQHQNIVPVYFVGCERGVHYYAMQFIDGQTVAAVIRELRQANGLDGTALPPVALTTVPAAGLATERSIRTPAYFRTVAQLAQQAAEALQHAHDLGVIHRDVKPGNLMLDGRGNLWVTDFGLARVQPDASLTLTGDLVGTVRYMSPEQASGRPTMIDHRTDVYSLGATLYELLTLGPAFAGSDRQELLRQITSEEPKPPRRVNKAIPAELETIVLKAMEKNPRDRYATAQELADDLHRWLEDKPIQARRPSFRQVATKWARRHRTAVTAAVVCLLVLLATLLAGLLWHNAVLHDAAEREHNLAVEADRQKEEAKKKRAFARRAADRMYMQVAEKWMTSEPGPGKLQREFLEEALRFYQELVQEPDDDPATQKELANAYRRMGEIHLRLGLPAEAAQDLGKAVDLAENLVNQDPDQADYADHLASVYYQLGNLNRETSHPKESETFFRQSLAIRRKLAARSPSDSRQRQLIGTALINLGHLLMRTDREREAEDVFREARPVLEQVTAESPETPQYHVALGGALNNLAVLLKRKGEVEEARKLLEDAIGHQRAALQIDPRHKMALQFLDNHYSCLSDVFFRLGETEKAFGAIGESIKVAERLVAEFPQVPSYRGSLAESQTTLGDFCSRSDRPDQAEAAYRSALATMAKAAADLPQAALNKRLLADIHNNLGTVLCKRPDRSKEAEAEFREAIRLRPSHLEAWVNLADALYEQGMYKGAVTAYQEALQLRADDADLRYAAARAAARAGCGQGKDADPSDDKARACLRRQALEWLRAELAASREALEKGSDKAGPTVRKRMQHCQQNQDFAGVRGPEALAKLPAAERQDWQQLWQDVEALRQRAANSQK